MSYLPFLFLEIRKTHVRSRLDKMHFRCLNLHNLDPWDTSI